jgi:hypothetical protein
MAALQTDKPNPVFEIMLQCLQKLICPSRNINHLGYLAWNAMLVGLLTDAETINAVAAIVFYHHEE